ncbi:MAG: PD40 domain-containing protein [Demequinaceae bacterium]|nr:PD40 domain-containing protein [Demequinaceae bacterium]
MTDETRDDDDLSLDNDLYNDEEPAEREVVPVTRAVRPRTTLLPALVSAITVLVVGGGTYAVVEALNNGGTPVVVVPSESPLAGPTPSIGASAIPQPDPSTIITFEDEDLEPAIDPLPIVSATPEPSPTPSPSETPDPGPVSTPTPSETPTVAPSPVVTPSPSPVVTPSPTPRPRQGMDLGEVYQYAHDAWSPTRPEFAFLREVNSVGEAVVAFPETGETRVISLGLNIPRHGSSIHWSHDGDSIGLLARNYYSGGDAFFVYSHDDWSQVARIDALRIQGVDWSDDGTRVLISYSTVRHDYYHQAEDCIIYEVDLVSGERTPIVAGVFPSWSPDEQKVAYLADDGEDGTWGTWVIDLASGEQTQLTEEHTFDRWSPGLEPNTQLMPSWSDDGSELVFVAPSERVYVGSDGTVHPRNATYLAQADGSDLREVNEYGSSYRPGWSPDGTKIYVSGVVYDATTLDVLFGVDTVIAGQVPDDEYLTRGSAKAIALYSWFGVQVGYQKVESGWHLDRFLGWSPDGQWIAIFGTSPDSEAEIKGIVPANGLP